MQPVSPAVVQHRYLPAYQPFTIASPPTFKSIDRTIYGPSVPPIKNTKTASQPDTDQRRLILFNVPVDLIQEYLELYLEHLSGEKEIERIDYSNLDDTTVMVTFKTDLNMADVRRRHATRSKLHDSDISLAEVTPPATVMIRNLPVDISRDVLELYFSNRRRSDGGQVTDVTLDQKQQHALVTFADCHDVRRVTQREHFLHGHRLDVRTFFNHMGIEPFVDASRVRENPEPIVCRASDDSRIAFLLKNRPLLDELREQFKPLNASVSIQTEGTMEILFTDAQSTSKRRLQWKSSVEQLVAEFLTQRLVIRKHPWNSSKNPPITQEQLADLSLKDNTRLMQMPSAGAEQDHIVVTALKDHLDRALNELTAMAYNALPPITAVYRSKPVNGTRDTKLTNHRSSVFLPSFSPPVKPSLNQLDLAPPPALPIPSNAIIDSALENLRSYQLDLLAMRSLDLARRTYTHLHIEVDRAGRRILLRGPIDQVNICKNYLESILNGIVYKQYRIGKEMAVFLSNPDTVELVIGNLARAEHVCAYEIERTTDHNRRSSTSPTSGMSSQGPTINQHKLVLYGLTRETCDRVHESLRHDIRVRSIMLDKDDRRVLASDSWHAYVRDLYSNPGGFRRRRVLLQIKQNQLTLVGFEHDVDAMRRQIYDYFVENAISFYESD